jgi:hypothetical protein
MRERAPYAFDFDDNVEGLGKTRRRTYDDGSSSGLQSGS